MKRPKLTVRSAAWHQKHAFDGETLAEFSFPDGKGGLICLHTNPNGTHVVEVFRCDTDLVILTPNHKETTR